MSTRCRCTTDESESRFVSASPLVVACLLYCAMPYVDSWNLSVIPKMLLWDTFLEKTNICLLLKVIRLWNVFGGCALQYVLIWRFSIYSMQYMQLLRDSDAVLCQPVNPVNCNVQWKMDFWSLPLTVLQRGSFELRKQYWMYRTAWALLTGCFSLILPKTLELGERRRTVLESRIGTVSLLFCLCAWLPTESLFCGSPCTQYMS